MEAPKDSMSGYDLEESSLHEDARFHNTTAMNSAQQTKRQKTSDGPLASITTIALLALAVTGFATSACLSWKLAATEQSYLDLLRTGRSILTKNSSEVSYHTTLQGGLEELLNDEVSPEILDGIHTIRLSDRETNEDMGTFAVSGMTYDASEEGRRVVFNLGLGPLAHVMIIRLFDSSEDGLGDRTQSVVLSPAEYQDLRFGEADENWSDASDHQESETTTGTRRLQGILGCKWSQLGCISRKVGNLKDEISDLKDDVSDLTKDIKNLKSQVSGLTNKVTALTKEVNSLTAEVSSVTNLLNEARSLANTVKNGITNQVNKLGTAVTDLGTVVSDVTDVADSIQSTMEDAFDFLPSSGEWVADQVENALKKVQPKICAPIDCVFPPTPIELFSTRNDSITLELTTFKPKACYSIEKFKLNVAGLDSWVNQLNALNPIKDGISAATSTIKSSLNSIKSTANSIKGEINSAKNALNNLKPDLSFRRRQLLDSAKDLIKLDELELKWDVAFEAALQFRANAIYAKSGDIFEVLGLPSDFTDFDNEQTIQTGIPGIVIKVATAFSFEAPYNFLATGDVVADFSLAIKDGALIVNGGSGDAGVTVNQPKFEPDVSVVATATVGGAIGFKFIATTSVSLCTITEQCVTLEVAVRDLTLGAGFDGRGIAALSADSIPNEPLTAMFGEKFDYTDAQKNATVACLDRLDSGLGAAVVANAWAYMQMPYVKLTVGAELTGELTDGLLKCTSNMKEDGLSAKTSIFDTRKYVQKEWVFRQTLFGADPLCLVV